MKSKARLEQIFVLALSMSSLFCIGAAASTTVNESWPENSVGTGFSRLDSPDTDLDMDLHFDERGKYGQIPHSSAIKEDDAIEKIRDVACGYVGLGEREPALFTGACFQGFVKAKCEDIQKAELKDACTRGILMSALKVKAPRGELSESQKKDYRQQLRVLMDGRREFRRAYNACKVQFNPYRKKGLLPSFSKEYVLDEKNAGLLETCAKAYVDPNHCNTETPNLDAASQKAIQYLSWGREKAGLKDKNACDAGVQAKSVEKSEISSSSRKPSGPSVEVEASVQAESTTAAF